MCPLTPSRNFFPESSEGPTNGPTKPRARAALQLSLQQHGAVVVEPWRSCRRGWVSATRVGTRKPGLGLLLLLRLPELGLLEHPSSEFAGGVPEPAVSCIPQMRLAAQLQQPRPRHHVQPVSPPGKHGWKTGSRQLVRARLCAVLVLLPTKSS